MDSEKDISYEEKILDCLRNNNYGLTVAGIAEKIGSSRNTVYRYLGILEGKELVFKKEIGRYNLYFSKEGRQVNIDVVASFYKGILIALDREFLQTPSQFKTIGKTMSDIVILPFETEDIERIKSIERPLKKGFIEVLAEIRPYISLLHDKIALKDIIVNEEERKLIIHFINSDILEEYEAGINHFYILTGFVEAKIKSRFNLNVHCEVLDYKISKKNEENYVRISLELI